MGEAIEGPEETERRHLCLASCPECRVIRQGEGACHLLEEHVGEHECNAPGGEVHVWPWSGGSRPREN
jgi:hypothetical protein